MPPTLFLVHHQEVLFPGYYDQFYFFSLWIVDKYLNDVFCRKFWTHDVPTIVNKAAPDYCTVYVISKGKQQSVRPAAKPLASSSARLPSSQPWSAARLSNYSEPEDISRYQITEDVIWPIFFFNFFELRKTSCTACLLSLTLRDLLNKIFGKRWA